MISVVMPVYNSDKYLDEAIWSIRRQTLTAYEIVLVDDGSTDGSRRILCQHAADDERIRVLEHSHQGLASSLNRGFVEAREEFVAIMHADDVSLPDRLAKQAAFLRAHPEVAVLGGAVMVSAPDSPEPKFCRFPTSPAEIRELLPRLNVLAHPTVMMRRSVLVEVGGYRPAFRAAEDYDLWLRTSEFYDLANLPDVLLRYRRHPGQASVRLCCLEALCALAARFGAERRRQTGHDPVSEVALVDHQGLLRMGVPAIEVERSLLGSPLTRAAELLAEVRNSEARQVLQEIWGLLSSQASSRSARSEIALWIGKTMLADHDHLRGAAWVARAYALAPSRFGKTLKYRIDGLAGRWTDGNA